MLSLRVSQDLLPASTAKKIEVVIRVEKDEAVITARKEFARLVCNLLDNAIKFSPKGGVVEIWSERENTETSEHFKNDGSGIPEQDQPYLFDRFWQGGRPGQIHTGVGMGLYLCRQIATAHCGTISCTSKMHHIYGCVAGHGLGLQAHKQGNREASENKQRRRFKTTN